MPLDVDPNFFAGPEYRWHFMLRESFPEFQIVTFHHVRTGEPLFWIMSTEPMPAGTKCAWHPATETFSYWLTGLPERQLKGQTGPFKPQAAAEILPRPRLPPTRWFMRACLVLWFLLVLFFLSRHL